MASDADGLYTFDGLGRMTGLTEDGKTIAYTYNGDGQRVSKTVDGVTTQYVWDGDYIVMEKTGNSTTVYKRGNRLFANEKDGIKTFYRYNARGDVVQLTNASYAVTKTYRYDAFGNEQNIDANDTNPFRYCGEYFDTETGYIYLRARYYDPTIGRFISKDPIRDGLNWYVYCGNNPVMFKDPLGLSITLSGTDEEKNIAFKHLQKLTDDKLYFDKDSGKVSYEINKNIRREVGTSLAREVIDNSIDCEIVIFAENNGYSIPIYDGDKLIKTKIEFNPNYESSNWSYVEGDGYSERIKPAYLILGHEMVHTIRRMLGEERDGTYRNTWGRACFCTWQLTSRHTFIGKDKIEDGKQPSSFY
ncbi:MAG: hypothetical protein IJN25_09710 [Clostridia bacterium]|nr:hypothetical protein [Clostridia bacterium]